MEGRIEVATSRAVPGTGDASRAARAVRWLSAVNGGSVLALALESEQRLSVNRDVPTIAEPGLPELKVTVWHGLFTVRGTPADVIAMLSRALQAAVTNPECIAKARAVGVVPATAERATPQSLGLLLREEMKRWKPLVDATGQCAD
ncbi:MAG: tripartite tricarboxylate transporter substrate-binding protein [Lautropia sp.]